MQHHGESTSVPVKGTASAPDLENIRKLEAEYRQSKRDSDERFRLANEELTQKLRFGLQRALDKEFPTLAPFAKLDHHTVEDSNLPVEETVTLELPEHAPIFVYLTRSMYDREDKWSVGKFDRYSSFVTLAVWRRGWSHDYYRDPNVGAVLTDAADQFAAYQAHRATEDSGENIAPAPPPAFTCTDGEKDLIRAVRAIVAEQLIQD